MPEFILDTGGQVAFDPIRWSDLDAFTQGYIEALFLTESEDLNDSTMTESKSVKGRYDGRRELGFSDLAPEALAAIISDCAAFQERASGLLALAYDCGGYSEARAGHDFWLTRNGHGAGFWDRDELKDDAPEALQVKAPEGVDPGTTSIGDNLTALCGWRTAFAEVNPYLGDNGKVYV